MNTVESPLSQVRWCRTASLGLALVFACAPVVAVPPSEAAAGTALRVRIAADESVAWFAAAGILSACEPGTSSSYRWIRSADTDPTSIDALADAESHGAHACRVRTNLVGPLAAVAGRTIVIYTSSSLGLSATWISAVVSHERPVTRATAPFLEIEPETCRVDPPSSGTAPVYRCTGLSEHRPDAGFSEVPPAWIVGDNASFDVSIANAAVQARSVPVLHRMVGVAVSVPLYRALQQVQGLPATDEDASRPTLDSAAALTMLAGAYGSWSGLLGPGHAAAGEQLNLCMPRRSSGVRAIVAGALGGFPCLSGAGSLASFEQSDVPSNDLSGIGRGPALMHIVEGDNERRVEQCLGTATARGGLAMGAVSLGRFPSDLAPDHWTHRFVRLDDRPLSRANAQAARWRLLGTSAFHWSRVHEASLDPPRRTLLEALAAGLADPQTLFDHLGPFREGVVATDARGYVSGTAAQRAFSAAFVMTNRSCGVPLLVHPVPVLP